MNDFWKKMKASKAMLFVKVISESASVALFLSIILIRAICMVVKKQVTTIFATFAIIVCCINILSIAASIGIYGLSIEYHFDGRYILTDIMRWAIVIDGLLIFLYCVVYIPVAKQKGWQY